MDILLWHEILEPYELAVKELQVKFRHLIKEHHGKGLYSPIESVSGRVKSVSSILEKMQRKGIVPEEMEEQVEDIAGIRIICQFVEDIEKVADLIQKRSDIEIKSEKDYIRHMKDSGYRSYHLIVYYTVETMNGPKRIQVEIQIRTMAMDFWARTAESYALCRGTSPCCRSIRNKGPPRPHRCTERSFHPTTCRETRTRRREPCRNCRPAISATPPDSQNSVFQVPLP